MTEATTTVRGYLLEDGRRVLLVGTQPGAVDATSGEYLGTPVTASGVGYLSPDTARGFVCRWGGPWVAVELRDGTRICRAGA